MFEEVSSMNNDKTYVCLGTCQAVITQQEYNNGLTRCGADVCTMKNQPFVKGKKSQITGKNEATTENSQK